MDRTDSHNWFATPLTSLFYTDPDATTYFRRFYLNTSKHT